MKKFSLCWLVLLLMLLCGCLGENSEPLITGKYELEDATGVTAPYILLRGNNGFIFEYSILSSYLNYGTFEIKDSTLILTTDDEAFTYVFQIVDGNLCFDLKSSSKLTEYKGKTSIEDGARFILTKEK